MGEEKKSKKEKKDRKSKKEKVETDSPKEKKRKRVEDSTVIDGSEVVKKSKVNDESKVSKKAKDAKDGSNDEPKAKSKDVIVVEDLHIDEYRPSAPKKEDDEIPENLRLSSYDFSSSTLKSLQDKGINQLFPIQAASFGHVMGGKDVLGRARTGTGKTLAFSLPIVEALKKQKWQERKEFEKKGRAPRALIMAPTRELAMQVHKELDSICSKELVSTCVYGGVQYDTQYYAMKDGLDVIIGTPGRLIDHIERGNLKLHNLRFICLDEADQMLDIGFADDMEKVLKAVQEQIEKQDFIPHQTLLFSATMPDWIKEAVKKYMKADKVTLDLIGSNKQKTSATVTHYCLTSRYQNRAAILGDIVAVYGRGNAGRTIIFVETKAEASELAMDDKLVAMGAQTLHGDIAQKQRETTMQGFRDGKFTVLITTNVCARGVDIPEVDLVINCEPPSDVESYIHRSGRTGRAGKSGVCITFYKNTQEYLVQNIARRAGVDFIKIGPPQPSDIVGARASQNIEELKNVDPAVFSYFAGAAKELLEYFEGDAQKALECAMAKICDTTKPLPSRSMLTANDGYVTVHFTTQSTIRNVGYIKSIMQKQFPELTFEDTIGWRMTADSKGVVVDIKESKIKVQDGDIWIAEKLWRNGKGVDLQIAKELPELAASYGSASGPPARGGYQNTRGGFSGRGNSRGGYGRGGFSSSGRGGSYSSGRGRGSFRGGRGGY